MINNAVKHEKHSRQKPKAFSRKHREWSLIFGMAKDEYLRFITEYKKQPDEETQEIIIKNVYDRLLLKGLKMSPDVAAIHITGFVKRQNRKFELVYTENEVSLQKVSKK